MFRAALLGVEQAEGVERLGMAALDRMRCLRRSARLLAPVHLPQRVGALHEQQRARVVLILSGLVERDLGAREGLLVRPSSRRYSDASAAWR